MTKLEQMNQSDQSLATLKEVMLKSDESWAPPLLSFHIFEHEDDFSLDVEWNGEQPDYERKIRVMRLLIEGMKDHIRMLEQQ